MEITYQEHPTVVIGSVAFVEIPTILQYKDTPLLEVGKFVQAGFSIKFPVFHSDGTKIAVVSGSQIYRTEEGKKANLTLRYPQGMTVAELEGKPILELRRIEAAAMKGWAGLYAPEGVLVTAHDENVSALLRGGDRLELPNGVMMKNSTFQGYKIGIHYTESNIVLGAGGGRCHIGEMRLGRSPSQQPDTEWNDALGVKVIGGTGPARK